MKKGKNPFLKYVDDFEKEAELFLTHYGYQDLIINPAPIPIREIIEKKMSLEIIDTEYLSPDASIQGITAFFAGTVEIFDYYEHDYVGYVLKEPAILIDSSYTNEGYINRILAHEAYHWYKHRAYFTYETRNKLSDEFAIRCLKTKQNEINKESWTNQQQMEYQAYKIAPMLLLPKKSVIKKVTELTKLSFLEFSTDDIDIEKLIKELSNFYKVTPYTMRIRLKQLGYNIETNVYDNELQVSYVKESIYDGLKQNSNISLKEAFELYQTNTYFKSVIDTGLFTYKNNSIYIANSNGDNQLDFLFFQTKLKPEFKLNSNELMFRQNQKYTSKKIFSKQPQNIESLDRAKQLHDKFMKEHKRKEKNLKTANQAMWEYMKDAKWNTSIFQDKTLLSPMDYTRIQREHNFGLKAYVAMAIGLELSLAEFNNVIKLAGLTFIDGNKEHDAYSFVLSCMNGSDIDTCNDFLESEGVEKLGTKSRWDDNQYK